MLFSGAVTNKFKNFFSFHSLNLRFCSLALQIGSWGFFFPPLLAHLVVNFERKGINENRVD